MTGTARAAVLIGLLFAAPASAYSVLTHEQIVDLLWKDRIEPLLHARFPDCDADDLRHAHAYAYGGSLVQDMGYYPFGNQYFSDLVHYVRSGDFVVALVQESRTIDEYAFALGALSHYSADNTGHPTINRAVALTFPKLRSRFGDEVTYADAPREHLRTEFGFDMVQVAKNRYTPDRYHDFIGFEVARPLLERAFARTYGMALTDALGHVDLAIGSFRRGVSEVIPEMTRVAVLSHHLEFVEDTPDASTRKFLYSLSRNQYEKEWGTTYRKPGLKTRILAFLLKLVPKIGPFQALAFSLPTRATEDMYVKSVNETVANYGKLLRESGDDSFRLPNLDCDTGRPTRAGEYLLSDAAYARLLDGLAAQAFATTTADLRRNILQFYREARPPANAKKNIREAWEKTLAQLAVLGAEDTAIALAPAAESN